jgi:hypothetical protein
MVTIDDYQWPLSDVDGHGEKSVIPRVIFAKLNNVPGHQVSVLIKAVLSPSWRLRPPFIGLTLLSSDIHW